MNVAIKPTPTLGVVYSHLHKPATDSTRTSNSSRVDNITSKNVTIPSRNFDKTEPPISRLLALVQPLSCSKRVNSSNQIQHKPSMSSNKLNEVSVAPINAPLQNSAQGSKMPISAKNTTLRMLSRQFVRPITNIFKHNKSQGSTTSTPLVISERITNATIKALEKCSTKTKSFLREKCIKNVLKKANWHSSIQKLFDWRQSSKEEASTASSSKIHCTCTNNLQSNCNCTSEINNQNQTQLLSTVVHNHVSTAVVEKTNNTSVAKLDLQSKVPTIRSYLTDFLSHIDSNEHLNCSNCNRSLATKAIVNSCKAAFIN